MISSPGAQPQQTSNVPKKGLKTVIKFIVVILLIAAALLAAIWHFGNKESHKQNKHPLYTSFDESPEHKKLLTQLQKSKYSILSGKKEDGLLQFVEHYANKLSQGNKAVFLEDYNADHFEYFQYVRDARIKLVSLIGQSTPVGDWILLSQNGVVIPQDIINKIKTDNLNGKLIIVTTGSQKVKGFKDFVFPKIKDNIFEGSISKTFKVKPHVADILYDYFQTPEKAFIHLGADKFDQKHLLGQSHRSLDGINKEQKAVLQTLCTKGVSKSKKESPKLAEIGVIHLDGSNYWQSLSSILNYELNAAVNCKNAVASEDILKAVEAKRQKEQQQRKAQEEIEKKKEEERKAEEERRQQEEKAKEEQKRLEEEKKKEEKSATKGKKEQKKEAKEEKVNKPAKPEAKPQPKTEVPAGKPAKSKK